MRSDVVTALIGVGATLAGTILGWLLNHFSNRGKLNIFVSLWEDKFRYNNMGELVDSAKIEDAAYYTFRVSFDLYNSSGNTKIMRNIEIVFNDGKKDIERIKPDDDAAKRDSSSITFYDKVEPINIPPKVVIKLNLQDGIWNTDGELDFIWKTKKVYLTYLDEKNKTQRKLIKLEDYGNYFKNHKLEAADNGQTQDADRE